MLAITGFAIQEAVKGKPVIEQTPIFFKPFWQVVADFMTLSPSLPGLDSLMASNPVKEIVPPEPIITPQMKLLLEFANTVAAVDPDNTTPMEALKILAELKEAAASAI